MDEVTVRAATPDDAPALAALWRAIDAESEYLLFGPGERLIDEQRIAQRLRDWRKTDAAIVFVAEASDGSLVGRIDVTRGTPPRIRHRADIFIGIRRAWRGCGIGTRFFAAAEAWARERGVHRLQLEVVTDNAPAVALYEKAGFSVEGTKRDDVCIDGRYRDCYVMGKTFSAA